MAILQISRITNRKGLTENLPQLAGAELGYCVDTRRLFIGNGTLQEGAPVIGNTEILTEFSDITVLSDYTYEDVAVGYTVQTGSTAGNPVVRSVQAKLDDQASVRDFGAVGDGVADDTAAINRALFQLYCRETNTQIRRSLFFPAGTYRVTDTILIPPYAKLEGEGANSSIIQLDTSPDISTLPAFVARFADSLQQIGANIGNNGATPPRNIEISSMSFATTEVTDVFLVQDAQQCWFQSVDFRGPLTESQIIDVGFNPAVTNIAGVRFSSTSANPCSNITFDRCAFLNNTYGVSTAAQLKGVTISNGRFNTLYIGVNLDSAAGGVRIVHNQFDTVFAQGIRVGSQLNVSAYNLFYNVGQSIGAASPTFPIIEFTNDNNVSVCDAFQRDDAAALIQPRIEVSSTGNSTSASSLQMGRYARENGRTFSLVDAASNQTIYTFITTETAAIAVDYTITRSTNVRTGRITITGGGTSSFTDDFVENSSTGITLGTNKAGAAVALRYSATSLGFGGIMTFSVSHLA